MVAKAPGDGYTIMMVPSGTYTISASTYTNLPYDAVRDFARSGDPNAPAALGVSNDVRAAIEKLEARFNG